MIEKGIGLLRFHSKEETHSTLATYKNCEHLFPCNKASLPIFYSICFMCTLWRYEVRAEDVKKQNKRQKNVFDVATCGPFWRSIIY